MAKRFYFPASTASQVNPSFDGGWTDTSEAVRRFLQDTKGSSAIAAGTQIGPMAGTAGHRWLDRQYVSRPLAAQTISGTVKAQLMVREYAANDNTDQVHTCIKVVSSDGNTVRATLLAIGNYGPTAEFINNASHRNKTLADGDSISSYTCVDGDRLLVEIGYSNSTGGTSPEGSAKWGENANDLAENETATTDGAGWIEFSATITFYNPALAGTSGGTSTVSASMTVATPVPMSGTSAGGSTAEAAMSVATPLSGVSPGGSTAVAGMSVQVSLSGATPGGSTAAAAMSVSTPLAGASNGVSTADAAITVNVALSGSSAGGSTATASMESEEPGEPEPPPVPGAGGGPGFSMAPPRPRPVPKVTLSGSTGGTSTASASMTVTVSLGPALAAGRSRAIARANVFENPEPEMVVALLEALNRD